MTRTNSARILSTSRRFLPVAILLLGLVVRASAQEIPNRSEMQIISLSFNDPDEDDFAPAYTYRDRSLYFTSTREDAEGEDGQQRIYVTRRSGQVEKGLDFSEPEGTGAELMQARHVGSATLLQDGLMMVFAAYRWDSDGGTLKGEGRTDLYVAEWRDGTWTNVANLGPVINTEAWDSQPAIAVDGRTLYFASDREGGYGGTDLYFSRRTATGWTAPENLGSGINTEFNETAPTIAPDGARFYFSSDRPEGAGGFDVYTAMRSGATAGAWGSVTNFGLPVNSEFDEYHFVAEPNSRNGFFASNREGNLDIFLAYPNPFPPEAQVIVSGKVYDEQTGLPVEASVTVSDLESGEVIAEFRSDNVDGEYTVILARGHRYSITADAPGYVFYSDEYRVAADLAQGEELRKDIPLRQDATRLLIFFDYDRADLKRESVPELRRAVEWLKENPDIRVEIGGHTDSVGSAEYNRDLSRRRAESVRNWFIREGVEAARLIATGYGEERPVADNGTEGGRARNRRVEMRVIE